MGLFNVAANGLVSPDWTLVVTLSRYLIFIECQDTLVRNKHVIVTLSGY